MMYFWRQNLNEPGSAFWHGRAKLFVGEDMRGLGAEWKHGLKTRGFNLSLTVRHFDDTWKLSLKIPYIGSWWLYWTGRETCFDCEREISFSWFDSAFHWKVWATVDSWSRDTPRWRDGWWNPLDTILGSQRHSLKLLSTGEVVVPMPEGNYTGQYQETVSIWKRPRWPFAKHVRRYEVEMTEPIPIPGKGENSWDCEDTAIEALVTPAYDVNDLVGRIVASAVRDRLRYGGTDWKPQQET